MSDKKILVGDMSRETAIGILKLMLEAMEAYDSIAPTSQRRNAVQMAIASLETDEAYQLEYERTTKNDLGVDYISKQEVVGLMMHIWGKNHSGDDAMQECIDAIRAMPSVTPIRPKGYWIETAEEYYKAINEKDGGVNEDTDYFVDDIACSECLAKFSVIDNEADRFDFCPCCGSDNR